VPKQGWHRVSVAQLRRDASRPAEKSSLRACSLQRRRACGPSSAQPSMFFTRSR
jgi:hypothetical protein